MSLAFPLLALYACAPRTPGGAVAAEPQPASARAVDSPIACSLCDAWNAPRAPFKIFGNTYYVGPAGLSSVLVVSSDGLVLLDGGLPQSAAVIEANLQALGFQTKDVRWIVNSHAHFDHAGGIAALQQRSGARVAASADGASALARGEPTPLDPQYASGHTPPLSFPPVPQVEVFSDGQTLVVGDVAITAHLTPGHTPGSTTWTWRSCEGERCLDVVYADSLNPISDDGFWFTGDATHADLSARFQQSIETIDQLPCDLLISVHPGFSGLDEKLAARARGVTPDPFIDPDACHTYAADAARKLRERIAEEQKLRRREGGGR